MSKNTAPKSSDNLCSYPTKITPEPESVPCPECGEMLEIYFTKWVVPEKFAWICPNYCNLKSFTWLDYDSSPTKVRDDWMPHGDDEPVC